MNKISHLFSSKARRRSGRSGWFGQGYIGPTIYAYLTDRNLYSMRSLFSIFRKKKLNADHFQSLQCQDLPFSTPRSKNLKIAGTWPASPCGTRDLLLSLQVAWPNPGLNRQSHEPVKFPTSWLPDTGPRPSTALPIEDAALLKVNLCSPSKRLKNVNRKRQEANFRKLRESFASPASATHLPGTCTAAHPRGLAVTARVFENSRKSTWLGHLLTHVSFWAITRWRLAC